VSALFDHAPTQGAPRLSTVTLELRRL